LISKGDQLQRVDPARDGCQAELIRIPWADGTLVVTPEPAARSSGCVE